jgi:hypothetical protein
MIVIGGTTANAGENALYVSQLMRTSFADPTYIGPVQKIAPRHVRGIAQVGVLALAARRSAIFEARHIDQNRLTTESFDDPFFIWS